MFWARTAGLASLCSNCARKAYGSHSGRSLCRQSTRPPECKTAIVVGDPCDPVFIASVFRGHDAVILALGGRMPTKAATSVYSRSADAIVEAVSVTGPKRVLVTSTALLFQEQTPLGRQLRIVVPKVVHRARCIEETLEKIGLDWTSGLRGVFKRRRRGYLPCSKRYTTRRRNSDFQVGPCTVPD
ncbi:NAD(P)H-binding protein [uncultured Roseobacter sp.]|uniref:NAD(P)H-binding protein n=1 Tax=uncultured Roseobacter sp. TaxID=114847 RepID=UPI00345DE5F8